MEQYPLHLRKNGTFQERDLVRILLSSSPYDRKGNPIRFGRSKSYLRIYFRPNLILLTHTACGGDWFYTPGTCTELVVREFQDNVTVECDGKDGAWIVFSAKGEGCETAWEVNTVWIQFFADFHAQEIVIDYEYRPHLRGKLYCSYCLM